VRKRVMERQAVEILPSGQLVWAGRGWDELETSSAVQPT